MSPSSPAKFHITRSTNCLAHHSQHINSTFTILTEKIYCPFTTCTQHRAAEKPTGFTSVGAATRHLQDCHSQLLGDIPLQYRRQHDIHVCQQCSPPRIFNNSNSLGNHHKRTHVSTRDKTNFTLLTETLYNNTAASHSHTNHWQDGIQWLQQHNQEPPPYRTSLLKCIKYQLEEPIDKLMEDIMSVCVEIKQPLNRPWRFGQLRSTLHCCCKATQPLMFQHPTHQIVDSTYSNHSKHSWCLQLYCCCSYYYPLTS